MRKGIEKNIWYCMAGKVENKIFEEYENENYHMLCHRTSGTFPIIASVSRTKITRSHGPITFWMRLFSTVLLTSSRVLTYRKSKLRKKRRINIWNYRSSNYLQCRPSWVTAIHRRTGRGGEGGCSASPQKIWVTQVFWAGREIWAKPVFKEVVKFFSF